MFAPFQNISFLSKLCWKILFFRKLVSTFISSHKFQSPSEEFWESTYKSHCSRPHTSLKAYKIFCNHSLRSIVQGYLLGVDKRCTRKFSSWCREELYRFGKGYFVKWCTRSWFWVYKIKNKENLKRVAWGLDVGHKDRSRIKSLMFAFVFFWDLFCAFTFLQVVYFLKVYKHYSPPL